MSKISIEYKKNKNKNTIQPKTLLKLFGATVLIGALTIYSYTSFTNAEQQKKQHISYINELQKLTERVEKNAYLTQSAQSDSFTELSQSSKSIDNILLILKKGGQLNENATPLLPINSSAEQQLTTIKTNWESNKALLNSLVLQGDNLIELKKTIEKANENNQRITDAAYNLQKSVYLSSNSKHNMIVQEIVLLLNRVTNLNTNLFSGENFSLSTGYSIVKDLKAIQKYTNLLITGSDVYDIPPITNSNILEHIKSLQLVYYPYYNLNSKVAENVPVLNSAKELSKTIAIESNRISADTDELERILTKASTSTEWKNAFYGLGFLTVSFGLFLMYLLFIELKKSEKRRLDAEKHQNNEKALTDLEEQIDPMNRGVLNNEISVSDPFVQKIAHPVNLVRKIFVNVISNIKLVSNKVLKDANEIIIFSGEVLKEADNQKDIISKSLHKIGEITSEMEDVAQNTYFTKEEAKKSEEMSKKGLITVNKSMEKMNSIRDNIQESSKKIKRLGESSQMIVEVTDLIRSITKEINALAFNAAIEATKAGETGTAFSTMATQVQRLAINSGAASKEIDDLIKNIQEDTASAISSMEETTQQVIDGTKLNDEAGYALQEVAKHSLAITKEIEIIAETIEEKSTNMIDISQSMTNLQKINNQNVIKINETVNKIDQITKISAELKALVDKYTID